MHTHLHYTSVLLVTYTTQNNLAYPDFSYPTISNSEITTVRLFIHGRYPDLSVLKPGVPWRPDKRGCTVLMTYNPDIQSTLTTLYRRVDIITMCFLPLVGTDVHHKSLCRLCIRVVERGHWGKTTKIPVKIIVLILWKLRWTNLLWYNHGAHW